MSAMNLNIPDSLKSRIEEIARRDNISVDQFVASAVAEKISALQTEEYIEQRAKRGNRSKFEAAMEMVPDAEPEEDDRL